MDFDPLGATVSEETDKTVPFPQLAQSSSQASAHSSASDKKLEDSRISELTSSDKLSALPTSLPNINADPSTSRPRRSPVLASQALPNRLYRRSMDATHSLPSFSAAEQDSLKAQTWKGPYQPTGGSISHSTSADTSQVDAKPRVSFESEPGPSSSRPQVARIPVTSVSEPSLPPSPVVKGTPSSRSPSPLARALSPLRVLQQLTANMSRHRHVPDEPFVPIDPYKFKRRLRKSLLSSPAAHFIHLHEHHGSHGSEHCAECMPSSGMMSAGQNIRWFFTDTLPRQIYLHLLLRLPSMYFTRVAKIFEDAEVSKPDIERMIQCGGGGRGPAAEYWAARQGQPGASGTGAGTQDYHHGRPGVNSPPRAFSSTPNAGANASGQASATGTSQPPPLPFPDEWSPPVVPHSLIRFKRNWEEFIDSILREWKTLNIVSALLVSAIISMFQVPEAGHDPLTRTAAFISLICALMSLSYGCVYIVRFGTMKSMYRACRWAEDARRTDALIWWNVWVLLAMPAVWMAWSMGAFIVAILSFVWRSGSSNDPDPNDAITTSSRAALGPRIAITCVLAIGLIYFALIVKTLRSYGTHVFDAPRSLHGPAGGASPSHTPRSRARDVEPGLEQRGRQQERRREKGPTPDLPAQSVVEVVNVEADLPEYSKDAGKLKKNMLGLTRYGSREPEGGGGGEDVDLEKGLGQRVYEKAHL